MEVDGRNGGNCIYPQALGMGGQLLRVGSVIAGHMGDDGQLALGLSHNILQDHLPFFLALVDALAGGTANVQPLHSLLDKPAGQLPDSLGADVAFLVVAGVERRDDALEFGNVSHCSFLLTHIFKYGCLH